MRENNLHIEMLKERFKIVFSRIPKEQWRFFHKKSLDNFIYYLPNIKGHSEKDEITQAINNYFDKINNGFEGQINMSLGKELFEVYLYPIARNFEWRQGFIPISSKKGLFFLAPLGLFFYGLFIWLTSMLFI